MIKFYSELFSERCHAHVLNAFEEEDADAAKEALNRPCVKDLEIEFTRMIKKIKLPDSGGLEAAAADFGAQRAAIIASTAPKPTFMDVEQEVDEVTEQEKLEKKDEDEEEELC